MSNPRFPHTLSILRPVRDAEGHIVLDEKGDATYQTLPLHLTGGRSACGCGCSGEGQNEIPCGYRTSDLSTREQGDVVVGTIKLSTPAFSDVLEYGDMAVIRDYDREYRAEVVKKVTFNLGSNVWIREVHN